MIYLVIFRGKGDLLKGGVKRKKVEMIILNKHYCFYIYKFFCFRNWGKNFEFKFQFLFFDFFIKGFFCFWFLQNILIKFQIAE